MEGVSVYHAVNQWRDRKAHLKRISTERMGARYVCLTLNGMFSTNEILDIYISKLYNVLIKCCNFIFQIPTTLTEFKCLFAPESDWGPAHMRKPSSTEMSNIKHQVYGIEKIIDGSTNQLETEQLKAWWNLFIEYQSGFVFRQLTDINVLWWS